MTKDPIVSPGCYLASITTPILCFRFSKPSLEVIVTLYNLLFEIVVVKVDYEKFLLRFIFN